MSNLKFKIKELTNIKFNKADLLEYFYTVEKDHKSLKWTLPSNVNTESHSVSKMYSWAIQSNLKDPSKPCPPYHIDVGYEFCEEDNCKVPTPMIFGFAKRILELFPDVRQLGIAGHPPGTKINLHYDNTEFLKIHLPIKTNKNALFMFESEHYNLEVGKAYLVNTTLLHGTDNQGNDDRIHLIFKFPIEKVEDVINTEYTI